MPTSQAISCRGLQSSRLELLLAGLPACVSSDTLHVVGGNNTPPSPPRALHGPVVSNADLPDLAKRRKVDEPSPAAPPPPVAA